MHFASINEEDISLQMIDVGAIQNHDDYYFLNTGTPHHVELVDDLTDYPVFTKGIDHPGTHCSKTRLNPVHRITSPSKNGIKH